MAKVLKGVMLTEKRSKSTYQEEWFNGYAWELKRGDDFRDIPSARVTLQTRARKLGMKSRVKKIDDDTIHFQVFNE